MKIGIDISQTAYRNTGVANYLRCLIKELARVDKDNQYVLFFSSLRQTIGREELGIKENRNFKLKTFRMPPTFLDFVWNKLHKMPIESLIGKVDLFITSDWAEPPAKARKATFIYDLIALKYPEETHPKTDFNMKKFAPSPNIVAVQKRKLKWVKKESDLVFTISQSSKNDIEKLLGINSKKIKVMYPGI